jgi:hypothetical protein
VAKGLKRLAHYRIDNYLTLAKTRNGIEAYLKEPIV